MRNLFFLFLFPLVLFSQEDLEKEKEAIFLVEKVESISKHTESPQNAPAFVYIIDKNTIKENNFKTLDEIIRFLVPGYFINNNRLYSFIGGRGMFLFDDYNTKILLLLNGHVLNEPWNNFAGLGREMAVPLEIVERIEVVYGPSTLLYGGYSFYGLINIITKKVEKNENEVFFNYGSFSTKEFIFSKSIKTNKFSFFGSMGFYSSEGENIEIPTYVLPDGVQWGGKQEGTDKEFSPFFYFYSKYKDFMFQGKAGYRNKNYPNAWYGTKYGSKNNFVIDRKNFFEVSYKKDLNLNSEFNFRIFTDYYSFFEHDEYEEENYYPGEEGYFYILPAENLTYGFETRFSHFFKKHFLVVGFEGRFYDVMQGYYLEDLDGKKDIATEVKISSKHYFKLFYLQDEIRISKNLRFVLGGNYLSISPGKNISLPRFALNLNFPNSISIKFISGQGFRNPSPYESNFYDIDYLQNLKLKSERINSNEINISYKFSKNTITEFSIFNAMAKDLIESVEIEKDEKIYYQYQNIGKLKSKGIIGVFESNLKNLNFKLNFIYQKGEKKEEENNYYRIKGVPSKIIKTNLSYKVKNFSLALASFWQSGVKLLEGHLIQDKNKIPSQYLFNLNLNYNFIYYVPLKMKLKIENLFNNRFYEPTALYINIPYFPSMGRKITLDISFTF